MNQVDYQSLAVVGVSTIALVIICVLIHYEALSQLTGRLKRIRIRPRPRILVMIFTILLIHVTEIWIFGLGYFALSHDTVHGELLAPHAVGLFDYIYYSATCYTTLGLGDLTPIGNIRFLTGMESLAGFVLIGWSVSFTYLEMDRFWRG
jgi:amino acid transporter